MSKLSLINQSKEVLRVAGITLLLAAPAVFVSPEGAAAQPADEFTGFAGKSADFGTGAETPLGNFVSNIVEFTNSILLPAVLAIAFFVFVWGIFQYFILGGANEEARDKGKNFMIYATLGFVFIVIFWGLVNFLATTIGLEDGELDTNQIKVITIPTE